MIKTEFEKERLRGTVFQITSVLDVVASRCETAISSRLIVGGTGGRRFGKLGQRRQRSLPSQQHRRHVSKLALVLENEPTARPLPDARPRTVLSERKNEASDCFSPSLFTNTGADVGNAKHHQPAAL